MSLINEYFEYQSRFENKYGPNTVVLMEVGSFFEIYGTDNGDNNEYGKIKEVSEMTSLSVAPKKGQTSYSHKDYVHMAGFPNYSIDKWKEIFIKNGYTVIIIEQDSHGTKCPNRTITEIVSPGINIESNHYSNNIMSIYIECINDYKSGKPILTLGLSIADITTGDNCIYETYSTSDDNKYILDEIFRFIQSHSPKEIIVHSANLDKIGLTNTAITKSLELSSEIIRYDFYNDTPELLQLKFREEILKKVFPDTGLISPIQYIGLERNPTSLTSFIYLLKFAYDHNETLITKLNKPVIWEAAKHLTLSHDSINQLNVISANNTNRSRITSLWSIIDKTVTTLGKRHLTYSMLNPIIDTCEIDRIYDLVTTYQCKNDTGKIYENIQSILKGVSDIQKLHRKMAIKKMQPYDFISLDLSYKSILELIKCLELTPNNNLLDEFPNDSIIQSFREFISDYHSKIKMNEILGVNLNTISESFFKKGVYTDIDNIQEKIDKHKLYFTNLAKEVGLLIDNSGKQVVDVKRSDKDDYFLTITKTRSKILSSVIKKNPNKIIMFNNGNDTLKISDLELKNTASQCKIFSGEIKQNSHLKVTYENRIKSLCCEKFSELLLKYHTQYSEILEHICKFVSRVDYIACIAKVSLENGYVRPIIDNSSENSFICAKDLRHPIIEKLNKDVQYVPNDVTLGTDNSNGILLYGVNAVGKSSYMKSIGLSIIMAQSGFFVPATEFTYKPYHHLFTRISGNDNLFKNQSTFAVEMEELRAILKRGNNKSLVLGDELCSGTETTSGLALVTAGVVKLSTKKSSFVFATHLHKLSDMPEIVECNNVNNFHMETIYDESTQELVYNRKLIPGSGNSIYGLEVAKAMKLDDEFLTIANSVRKRLLHVTENIIDTTTSNYNSDKIVADCQICGKKATEVHHIKEQHTADENGMIGSYHKNSLFNLVSLCHDCHHNVHHGNLIIDGYVNTSGGTKLSYKYTPINGDSNGLRKKKYSDDQIAIIKDIYSKTNNFTQTKQYLSIHNQITISTMTIKKIINNMY